FEPGAIGTFFTRAYPGVAIATARRPPRAIPRRVTLPFRVESPTVFRSSSSVVMATGLVSPPWFEYASGRAPDAAGRDDWRSGSVPFDCSNERRDLPHEVSVPRVSGTEDDGRAVQGRACRARPQEPCLRRRAAPKRPLHRLQRPPADRYGE